VALASAGGTICRCSISGGWRQLALIEEADGACASTELGLQRYAGLERPVKWTDETAAEDVSRLLTKRTKPDGS